MASLTRIHHFIRYLNQVNRMDEIDRLLPLLEKAHKANKLIAFLDNRSPYGDPAKSPDPLTVVLALNVYGADQKGFAAEVNAALKKLAKGSAKQTDRAKMLMLSQIELQKDDISMIDFADDALYKTVQTSVNGLKHSKIVCHAVFCGLSAIGVPLWFMIFFPIGLISMVAFFVFIALMCKWIGKPSFKDDQLPNLEIPLNRLFAEDMHHCAMFNELFSSRPASQALSHTDNPFT